MYRRIVVGLDGSPGAHRALEAAVVLARVTKADLFLVSIMELPRYPGAIDEVEDEQHTAQRFFQKIQKEAVARVTAAGLVVHSEIRAGHAAQALPHYVLEMKGDLLVIGHSGRSGIWGKLLGTTADKVVDLAPCSVLIVR
jgi:nucleotide-binding universal stress UspA family protein